MLLSHMSPRTKQYFAAKSDVLDNNIFNICRALGKVLSFPPIRSYFTITPRAIKFATVFSLTSRIYEGATFDSR